MSVAKRESGIELMRVIAIIMIMVVHATYLTFGFPQVSEVRTEPLKMFCYIGTENLSIICVDVFVLISGWFGIRPTIRTVGGLIFQCLFFGAIVRLFLYYMGISVLSLKSLYLIINFFPFVNSYIVLCLIAPVLNAYSEKANKSTLRNFLLAYFSWGFIMGWLLNKDGNFFYGNTAICFIGFYLLARYIRLYVVFPYKYDKPIIWFVVWITSVVLLTTLEVVLALFPGLEKLSLLLMGYSISYISPVVIINSLFFFLCFRKMKFSSNVINWIAISAFASVLLHANMNSEFYCPTIRQLYENNSLMFFLFKVFGFMSVFFIIGLFLDKLRIYVWSKIYLFIENIIN